MDSSTLLMLQQFAVDASTLLMTKTSKILLAALTFGGFGGLVAHILNNEKISLHQLTDQRNGTSDIGQSSSGWYTFPSGLKSVLVGSGGAIGFLFFMIAIGGVNTFSESSEQLRLISVSLIAGFGARNLLPKMVSHLEKQIADVETKADEAKRGAQNALTAAKEAYLSAEENFKQVERQLQQHKLNTRLHIAANKNTKKQEVLETIADAKRTLEDAGTDVAIWINYARVQRWHIDISEAIKTLERAAEKTDRGTIRKTPASPDIYFNLGCYYWVRSGDGASSDDRVRALSSLRRCLTMTSDPGVEATAMLEDEDLLTLREDPEFRALVREFQAGQ